MAAGIATLAYWMGRTDVDRGKSGQANQSGENHEPKTSKPQAGQTEAAQKPESTASVPFGPVPTPSGAPTAPAYAKVSSKDEAEWTANARPTEHTSLLLLDLSRIPPACRRQLPPRFQARLLARNHRRILTGETTEPIQDLKRDILASIAQFPAEWLLAHRGTFNNVFRELASGLKIKPQPLELKEILDRMEPPYQQDFARCIALMM